MKLSLLLPASGPSIGGAFNLTNVRRGDTIITQTSGSIAYANGKGRASASAKGRAEVPFSMQLDASLDPERIVLNGSGTIDNRPVTLSGPAVLKAIPGGWLLAPVVVLVVVSLVLRQGSCRIYRV